MKMKGNCALGSIDECGEGSKTTFPLPLYTNKWFRVLLPRILLVGLGFFQTGYMGTIRIPTSQNKY